MTNLAKKNDYLKEALEMGDLSCAIVKDLGALFRAIILTPSDPTLIKRLAGIGQYLANDWGNTLDGELVPIKQEYSKRFVKSHLKGVDNE